MVQKRKIRYGWTAVLIASLFLVLGCGSISGTVSSEGAALPGVTVELTGPTSVSTKTDACGNYRFPWLAKGTYTITPLLTGYSFAPAKKSVTMDKEKHITGVNFEGSSGSAVYSISGTVTSGVGALSGVTVSLAGGTSASTTTDASGNYQFRDLPGGAYTVTPSSIPGYGFTPANVTLNEDITVNFVATPNTARAWGDNELGQLGDGTSAPFRASPVEVRNLSRVIAVAAGVSHSLALLDDGTVWAWGQGTSGQLGDGLFANSSSRVAVSATWGSSRRAVAIAAGGFHSLALLDNGEVWAWGLGVVAAEQANPLPVRISDWSNVIAIAAGRDHSLALLGNGTVWSWGSNSVGQLGDGTLVESYVPVLVEGLTGITAIACGGYHSMAIGSGGTVWTWGDNLEGQLGWGTLGVPSSTPGQVVGISNVVSIAGGDYHSIAATSTGQVLAWGLNVDGQLGVNPSGPSGILRSITPVGVTGLPTVSTIAAGSSHSVAAGADGSVWTWGFNENGQLGNGSTGSYEYTPAAVSGLTSIIKVAAGSSHTLVVTSP